MLKLGIVGKAVNSWIALIDLGLVCVPLGLFSIKRAFVCVCERERERIP